MTLDQLATFRAVARRKSFRLAAEDVHITQPAVSKQIRSLEEDLGERLLERGRKVRLTMAGEVLLRHADRVAQTVEVAKEELGDLRSQGGGRLAIAAYHVLAVHFLPHVLEPYRQKFPGVRIRVETGWPKEVVERVMDREVDLGLVVLDNAMRQAPSLSAIPLFTSEMIFVAPASSSLPVGREVSVDQLGEQSWILCQDGCPARGFLETRLRERGLALKLSVETNDHDLQRKLLDLGLGVSIQPKSLVVERLKAGRLKQFFVPGMEFHVESGVIHRRDKFIHAAMRGFLNAVQRVPKTTMQRPKAVAS